VQDPPKFTQIWIFGLKTNHLATLVGIKSKFRSESSSAFAVCVCSFAGGNDSIASASAGSGAQKNRRKLFQTFGWQKKKLFFGCHKKNFFVCARGARFYLTSS
jgi:hypothetical protein